jgi:hypothetical protein
VREWLGSRYWDVESAVPPTPWTLLRADEIMGRMDRVPRTAGDMDGAFTEGLALLRECAHDHPDLCEMALLSPLSSGLRPPDTG